MRYDDDRSGPFGVLIATAVMFVIAGIFAATVVIDLSISTLDRVGSGSEAN